MSDNGLPGDAGGPLIKTRRKFLERMLRLGAVAIAMAATARDKLIGPARAAVTIPRPDHTVVVMFENTTYGDIVGKLDPVTGAPYFNSLRAIAANMTRSIGISHPTDPNYLALFSGSTQGITGNTDPRYPQGANLTTPNLAAQLIAKGLTFGNYQQDLRNTVDQMIAYNGQIYAYLAGPNGSYFVDENVVGYWVGTGTNRVPKSVLHDLKDLPADFSQLPTVSFWHAVEDHDGHQGYPNEKVNDPDNWMKNYLSEYIEWAMTHNSLLIITWDESYTAAEDPALYNHIPTLFIGPMVQAGDYADNIDHYDVLRTIEDMYGLPYAGAAATSTTLTSIWSPTVQPVVALTSPPLLSNWTASSNIDLVASVTANGHAITKVQFYNGTTLLGEAATAPFAFTWANVPANYYGYSLTAKAIYDGGAVRSSAPVPIGVYPSASITTGLVAYLNFDNNINAQGGTTVNGTKQGPVAARYVAGKFGQAASFRNSNSTGSLNDWAVSLGNLDSVYAGSFSVSLWVRTTSMADAAIIGNKDWTSGANVGWLVSTYPSAKTINWNTQGGNRRDVGLDPPIYDGQWHLVTLTVNRAQNQVTSYIDGNAHNVSDLRPSGTASLSAGFNTLIGGSGNGKYSGTADIDDAAIWSRVLSPVEVAAIYANGQAGLSLLGGAPVQDTTPPTVSAGESGTSGTITLSATASDNVGVTKVEFYVDNIQKGFTTTAPYSMTLNSTTLTDGTHALVAKAYDAAGNVGTSAAVNFAISNAAPPVLAITTANPVHGQKIAFSFNTPAGKSSKTNWIGIYPAGITPNGSPAASAWVYANSGTTKAGKTTPASGSVSFGQGLAAGNYAAWFLYNDGYGVLGGPVAFTLN